LALLSELGGLAGVIFAFISFLCIEITHVEVIDKFVQTFYTNSKGEIYFLDSERTWPIREEVDKS